MTGVLSATGARVRVAPAEPGDAAPYRVAVEASRHRLREWNPVNSADLEWHLARQGPDHRTFLIHALDSAIVDLTARDPAVTTRRGEPAHRIVGKVNVTNVVRGRAHSATLGYDAYDPYAGRGLFAEGLRLIVSLALAPAPIGMGLHRVEACVQPGNVRSTQVLRALGFRRRGAWPAYLMLPDASGVERWRDHVIYGITEPEWPAEPYSLAAGHARPAAVVLGEGESDRQVAYRVAAELAVPLIRADLLAEADTPAGAGTLASIVSDCPAGLVVLAAIHDRSPVMAALAAAGLPAERVAVSEAATLRRPREVAWFAAHTQALSAR